MQTAANLGVHRQTVVYRIRRIEEITGQDVNHHHRRVLARAARTTRGTALTDRHWRRRGPVCAAHRTVGTILGVEDDHRHVQRGHGLAVIEVDADKALNGRQPFVQRRPLMFRLLANAALFGA